MKFDGLTPIDRYYMTWGEQLAHYRRAQREYQRRKIDRAIEKITKRTPSRPTNNE